MPHPDLDFQAPLDVHMPRGEDKDAQMRQLWAERRTDPTDVTSVADPYVAGNPDRFGPNPPLVRESKSVAPSDIDVTRPGGVKGAPFRTGVTREE